LVNEYGTLKFARSVSTISPTEGTSLFLFSARKPLKKIKLQFPIFSINFIILKIYIKAIHYFIIIVFKK